MYTYEKKNSLSLFIFSIVINIINYHAGDMKMYSEQCAITILHLTLS